MAELVLAVVPVAAKVLQGCLETYKLFTEAKELGSDSQPLIWKFRIQQTRLQIWGEEWGLLASSSHHSSRTVQDEDEENPLVLETLLRISDILRDYKQLRQRYGLTLVSDDPQYRQPGQHNTVQDLIASEFDAYQTQDIQLQKDRSKAASFLTKFRWAVSDRTKLETIIVHLRDCNDGLYHLLSATERRRLRRALAPELVTMNMVPSLVQLEEASRGNSVLSNMAALRRFNLALTASTQPSAFVCEQLATAIPITSIGCSSASGQSLEVAAYASSQTTRAPGGTLLLEWKQYGNSDDENAQETRTRNLASMLQRLTAADGLCIPQCLGYTADHQNYRTCLIFKYPVGEGAGEPPETLHRLLSSKGVPPLGDRFRLALNLATSLSALHTSGWLHKQLSSHNVLLFPQCTASDRVGIWRIPRPFIVGFEYSRPNEQDADSEAVVNSLHQQPYRHPNSQGPRRKRFCRAFDVYSLGVMLLEIGYWRPISQFVQDSEAPEKLLHNIVKHYAPRLSPKTGTLYAQVVRNCFDGALADPALDEAESQRLFYWSVVGELERLVV